jgi:threonine aldolase
MGGVIFPQARAVEVCAVAREHGLATYLDGARLWNAAMATGLAVAELAAPFDLVMVSMSKGLGAPGGSLLAGPRELIAAAVRYRRMLGGAMRQVGLFAAAAEYALDHNLQRLAEDHESAKMLGALLAQAPRIRIDPQAVQTNVLVFELENAPGLPDAFEVVAQARRRGVLVNALSAGKIRALTHLDAPYEACQRAGGILLEILGG